MLNSIWDRYGRKTESQWAAVWEIYCSLFQTIWITVWSQQPLNNPDVSDVFSSPLLRSRADLHQTISRADRRHRVVSTAADNSVVSLSVLNSFSVFSNIFNDPDYVFYFYYNHSGFQCDFQSSPSWHSQLSKVAREARNVTEHSVVVTEGRTDVTNNL